MDDASRCVFTCSVSLDNAIGSYEVLLSPVTTFYLLTYYCIWGTTILARTDPVTVKTPLLRTRLVKAASAAPCSG